MDPVDPMIPIGYVYERTFLSNEVQNIYEIAGCEK